MARGSYFDLLVDILRAVVCRASLPAMFCESPIDVKLLLNERHPIICTMTNQLQLPYDIWESIVGIFGDELDEEFDIGTPTMSLRGLSQSCKSMVPFCRKYLFSTLILPDDTERSRRFKALITNNPSLISYVRRLEYHLDKGDSDDNCAILDVLKTSSSVLQSIFICAGPHKHQWETLSTSIQFALEHLVQLSTAIELEIVGIKGVPSTLLANAANISRLSLYGTDFRLTEAWPRRTFKPVYLHVGCDSSSAISFLIQRRGQTKDWSVVDFSHLTHAVFDIQNTQQTMVIWKALQVAPVIELLSLDSKHNGLLSIDVVPTTTNMTV